MEKNNEIEEQVKNEEITNEEAQETENVFKPITSQEELNKIIKNRLERERSKYADYDTTKSQLESLNSTLSEKEEAISKLSEEAEKVKELEAKAAQSEFLQNVLSISEETGIPASCFTRGTEDELRKQAESILKFVETKQVSKPGFANQGKTNNQNENDPLRSLFRK